MCCIFCISFYRYDKFFNGWRRNRTDDIVNMYIHPQEIDEKITEVKGVFKWKEYLKAPFLKATSLIIVLTCYNETNR